MMEKSLASPAPHERPASRQPAPPSPRVDGPCILTLREIELMQGLAAGRTNQQMATDRNRSEKTVRNQLTRLYLKLGARNRAEAVAIYLKRGG